MTLEEEATKAEEERVCGRCKFFKPAANAKSSRGDCRGIPTSTIGDDDEELRNPKWPRRDSYDEACGLFQC